MTQAAYSYVNDPRCVDFNASGRLVVSSLYVWFEENFGGDEASVIDHLTTYATDTLRTSLDDASDIGDDRYDWSLNDATSIAVPTSPYKGSGSRGWRRSTHRKPRRWPRAVPPVARAWAAATKSP